MTNTPARLFFWLLVLAAHGAMVLLLPSRRVADVIDPTYIQMLPSMPDIVPARAPAAAAGSAAPVRRRVPAPAPSEPAAAPAPEPAPEVEEAAPALPLEQMRRGAGTIDRELRKGKLDRLTAPDTPMARFRAGVDDAYAGGGNGVTLDRYVAADGVTTTRMTIGGKATCYMSSYVNASHSAMFRGSAPSARKVNCPPADAGWVRH